MTRRLLAAAVAGTLIASPSAPLHARPGDAAWTACVWSSASASADRWLAMPVPTWRSPYTDASVLLGHRLIALCDGAAADPLRPNRMPDWKRLASALKRSKPRTAPAAAAASPAEVLVCASATREEPFTYLFEIVRRTAAGETVSFQQYYTQAEGQSLKLPQDLRVIPPEGTPITRTCSLVGPEGQVTDA